MFDQPHDALRDAMQAQCIQQRINADWPIACYMQAVALSLLNRDIDSANKLKEATAIDEALDTLLKRYATTCFHICQKSKFGVKFLH